MSAKPWMTAVLLVGAMAYGMPAHAELTAEQKQEIEDAKKNFKYSQVTTPQGLVFRVPEDMPIETRAGIQAPIPFDEYMYGKFKQMDDRLKSIEAKLGTIEALLVRKDPPQDKNASEKKTNTLKIV